MRTLFAAGLIAALASVPAVARADAPRSLGEVAAKDKDKKKPGKVYTEDDLRNPRRGGTYSQPGSEGGAAAPAEKKAEGDKAAGEKAGDKNAAGEKPKTEEEERAERAKQWREKLTKAEADVATWTAEVSRLQALVNDNTGPMYGPGRAARVEAFENAKRQLTAANQAVADLQEEGRRNAYR